ncbi:MAG: universal stress protein [Halobaculum sp.]
MSWWEPTPGLKWFGAARPDMYRILLPVDDDETRAQRQAGFVTELPVDPAETHVTVTHALDAEERGAPTEVQDPRRIRTVKIAVEALEDAGIETSVRETANPPAEGIVRLAEEIDADQIVMGGRKRSPAGKALFGSVTQSVLLDTDRAVTVTGGDD